MTRILVLYGAADGHTARVVRTIVDTLSAHYVDADVIDARRHDPDPRGYSGVIVAAPVHFGGLQRGVKQWLRRHARALRDVPSAIVAICAGVVLHDPKVARELDAVVDRFLDATGWHPGERRFVAGSLAHTRYTVASPWMVRGTAARAGGDVETTRDHEDTDRDGLRAFTIRFADRSWGRDAVA